MNLYICATGSEGDAIPIGFAYIGVTISGDRQLRIWKRPRQNFPSHAGSFACYLLSKQGSRFTITWLLSFASHRLRGNSPGRLG